MRRRLPPFAAGRPVLRSLAGLWLLGVAAAADDERLSLSETMRLAMDAVPDAAADLATARAASARVAEARAELWPDLDLAAAATIGSGNIVAGAIFQPPGLPSISGPPDEVSLLPSWQAQGSAAFGWDATGLLARIHALDASLAARDAEAARLAEARLERGHDAAFAWLAVIEAAQRLDVTRAELERAHVLRTRIDAWVEAGLRPGVDRALATADVARTEQARARAVAGLEATRAALFGGTLGGTPVGGAPPLGPVPTVPPPPTDAAIPPPAAEADAVVAARDEALAAARAAYLPRVELLAAGWVRSGVWPPGTPPRTAPNWSVGVVVDVPLFDLPAERARVREAAAERDAAAHRLESVRIAVAAQVAEAEALLEGARHVDAQSRAIVATAAEARTQAEAQYEAGLVDIGAVTVAVARHREAQLDAVRTRLDVLRAALTRDLARGDLSRWLEEGR